MDVPVMELVIILPIPVNVDLATPVPIAPNLLVSKIVIM
jgi:hypothetical protein